MSPIVLVLAYVALGLSFSSRASAEPPLDSLRLGDAANEQAHHLRELDSEVAQGGLGQPARALLPLGIAGWEGGHVTAEMKVDAERQNYCTVKLWGSEVSKDLLILFCNGKQVGYRHLGDVSILFAPNGRPPLANRFFYVTTPLPLSMTRGEAAVQLEIRSTGPIWAYGKTWEQYQQKMTEPSCNIYRVYTHADPCFEPPPDELQGSISSTPPIRQMPGDEVLRSVEIRVNKTIRALLDSPQMLDQMQLQLLARAYRVKWTPAYQNPAVIRALQIGADEYLRQFQNNPTLAQADTAHKDVYNSDWLGLGPLSDAIRLLAKPLQPLLDEKIDDGVGKMISRRVGWSEMLRASRDWHRRNRREYTNQSMITDLYFYLDNRALEAIDPAYALPEAKIRHYLYQSVGLEPWLGSDTDSGPSKPLGDNYYQLTSKALTKELGFVGYYGEVLDWATTIYLATADPDKPETGDERIKAQLIKIATARSYFRYPEVDDEGNRAMRAETIVGWRDESNYPGDVTYYERTTWDASPLYCAAATLSAEGVGASEQMFRDNQLNALMQLRMKDSSLRVTAGMLPLIDDYTLLKAQPTINYELPMTKGQPDFAWADEEDGVVAVKNGDEIFYASLYWRARSGVNHLARVHLIDPRFDRIAVVFEDENFVPNGAEYLRPDWVNFGFENGGLGYPGDNHSAEAGESLPIARYPTGAPVKPGVESPYAGRGSFYELRYGKYLVAMNTTSDKTFPVDFSNDEKNGTALDMMSHSRIDLSKSVNVGPRSTEVILFPRG